MIKSYLTSHIEEQIERSLTLKSLIPRPIGYPELIGLADRCGRILDDNIEYLRHLLRELEPRTDDDIRDLYRSFRVAYRSIETIEYFGIPALHFQSDDVKFLNKLVFNIHNEVNLPFVAPSIACFSNRYYWIHGITNVMFMPIGEANSLLHLPDIYHELGHATLFNMENDRRLEGIKDTYEKMIKRITDYFRRMYNRQKRRTGPQEMPILFRHLHSQWKSWINEFFSDLFAAYILGPAYAWAHLHLTTKKSDDIYKFEKPPIPQTHPSDDSRMRLLEIGLREVGFSDEVRRIVAVWEKMPFAAPSRPIYEYQYAYPISLLREIAKLVLTGMEKSEISITTPETLDNLDEESIRKILNESWKKFWIDPKGFRGWEAKTLKELSRSYR